MEHEPALKKLLDGWSSCWLSVQKERRDLQEKAKNLFLQKQIAKAIADVLGPVAVEQHHGQMELTRGTSEHSCYHGFHSLNRAGQTTWFLPPDEQVARLASS